MQPAQLHNNYEGICAIENNLHNLKYSLIPTTYYASPVLPLDIRVELKNTRLRVRVCVSNSSLSNTVNLTNTIKCDTIRTWSNMRYFAAPKHSIDHKRG